MCRRWATGPPSIDSASEREPQSLLQALVLSFALGSPAFLHRHGPMLWRGNDPWPGVTHAQGWACACWLIYPWLPAERPPAQAATRGGKEEPGSQEKQAQQFGPGLVLRWLCAGGKGEEEVTAGGKISLHLGGTRPGSLGTLLVGAINRTLWPGVIEMAHTSPQILTFIIGQFHVLNKIVYLEHSACNSLL